MATGQSIGPPLHYTLGYTSTNHSSSVSHRQITVEVSRPGVTVAARKGYYGGASQRDDAYPEDTPDLVKPVVQERREATYTGEAARAKIQGDVVIEAVVGVDGRITRARVAGSLEPSLDESALSAVGQWTLTPDELKGVKVPVLVRLVVAFRLH